MPSTGEGFGIVFLEAVASGLPVIGGDRDGTRDALADGRIGTLVDPGDMDLLAEAIISGLGGRAPRDPARAARFTYPAFARHVHDLVGELA
jgi:glycosyltransferase involved in cell wall biosynthesis